jgi:hypothetical protein
VLVMARRGVDRRRVCAEDGCREVSITRYELKRDYAEAVRREKDQPPWKCLKHAEPDKVLSVHNREIVYITEPSRELFSERYPDISHGIRWGTSGTMYGPGFRAWAEDLPLGTQVVVTAQLIFPAGYQPPPAPDAPADPVPAPRPIAAADVVDLD